MANFEACKEPRCQSPWVRPVRFGQSLMNKTCLCFLWILALSAFAQEPDPLSPKTAAKDEDKIKISIFGEVNHPQTLSLPKGSTLKEAIKAAGGATPGGASNRINVFQDKRLKTSNIKKEAGPVLLDNALVVIPFKIVMDEPQAESALIVGGIKSIPLEELKSKLQPVIKGEWVINSLPGRPTLDVRMGAGSRYRMFSIYLLPPDEQTPEQGNRKLYSITAFPIGYGYGNDTLAKTIFKHLQKLCQK